MDDLVKALKIISIVGIDDHEKLLDCFKVVANPQDAIESFSGTESGLNHVMITANTGFNLLLKHRETYRQFTDLNVDEMLKGFHSIELLFEKAIEQ